MTRHHAFKVFIIGFVLIATHNIDHLILKGWSSSPLLEMIPYLLILIFWSKMKDMVLGFLLLLFGFLGLNHTIVTHIPELLSNGFGRTSITQILFDIGSILLVVASIMLFQVWQAKKDKEKID